MEKWKISLIIGIIVLLSLNFVSAFNWNDGRIVSYYTFDEGTGNWLNDSLRSFNGTLINNPEWIGGILNKALNFSNASVQYINFTTATDSFNVTGSGNFSVSVWIYPNSSSGNLAIASKQDNWVIRQDGLKLKAYFMDEFDDAWHNGYITDNDVLNVGKWQHIVFSYNGTGNWCGSSGFFAVNGSVVATSRSDGHVPCENNTNNPGNFRIGKWANLNVYNWNGGIDEFGFWNRTLSLSEILELYNGGTGMTYFIPFVSLYSPADGLLTDQQNLNFTANYTFSTQWINGTYYFWYDNTSLYRTMTKNITGTTNSTTQNLSEIPVGGYVWNVLGCYNVSGGTFECIFDLTNRSFYVNGKVSAIGYSTQTYQTQYENFSIEVHVPPGSTVTLPKLIYNGTNYTATSLQNNATSYNFSKSFSIPATATLGNMNFYWVWTINGVNFSSDTYYQMVNETIFILCNETYATPFLNLTFKDEVSLGIMNATIDSSTFNYWLGNGSVYKTYTFLNTTLNYYYTFCAFPNITLHNTASVQYSSTGYAQRRQYYSTDLTNSTTTKILYLLPLGDGIYSVYQVQDQNGNSISGVSVTAERQISGVWYTLESGTTDTAGAVTFWLNPNYDHRLTFIKIGYLTVTVTVRPSSSTYSVVMTTGAGGSGYNSTLASGISWKYGIVPFTNVLSQNTIYTFWFWVNSTSGNLVGYKMELLDNNSNILSTTTGVVATGSNLTVALNTSMNTSIRGRYSIDTGDGYVIVDSDMFWPVFGYTIPERGTIKAFITYLDRVNIFGTDEGRIQYTKALLFFIILFMVLGAISYSTGWDFATTGGAVMLLFPIILIASIAGFFNITYLPAGAGELASVAFLQRYTVAIIAGLLSGSYAFNKLAEGRGG